MDFDHEKEVSNGVIDALMAVVSGLAAASPHSSGWVSMFCLVLTTVYSGKTLGRLI